MAEIRPGKTSGTRYRHAAQSQTKRPTYIWAMFVGAPFVIGYTVWRFLEGRHLLSTVPTTVSIPKVALTVGSIYVGLFLAGLIVLFVASLVTMGSEAMHDQCTELMLQWACIFTFRLSRISPGEFSSKGDSSAHGGNARGRHRSVDHQVSAQPESEPEPTLEPPKTEGAALSAEQYRDAFNLFSRKVVRAMAELQIDRDLVNACLKEWIQPDSAAPSSDETADSGGEAVFPSASHR
jgi:hypothetical protein